MNITVFVARPGRTHEVPNAYYVSGSVSYKFNGVQKPTYHGSLIFIESAAGSPLAVFSIYNIVGWIDSDCLSGGEDGK